MIILRVSSIKPEEYGGFLADSSRKTLRKEEYFNLPNLVGYPALLRVLKGMDEYRHA